MTEVESEQTDTQKPDQGESESHFPRILQGNLNS